MPRTSWRMRRARQNCAPCDPLPAASSCGAAGRPASRGRKRAFAATVSEPGVKVNHAWFRGGWWDALTMAWKDVERGACLRRAAATERPPSPGATLFVPLRFAGRRLEDDRPAAGVVLRQEQPARRARTHSPGPGRKPQGETYRPWYAGRFADIDERDRLLARPLRRAAREATRGSATASTTRTLPPEVIEAVAANLTILKSPTVLRQADGRLWGWEGCGDNRRLLPRLLHARLELRPGHAAPVPRPGADACARRSSGRRRTSAAIRRSAARCRSGRSSTTSTPRPTASSAAS